MKISHIPSSSMVCPICNSIKVKRKFFSFPGYIENTNYDIFECSNCDSQFIDIKSIDNRIYDLIYAQKNIPGYDRYFNYAKKVKTLKNPLKWLSQQESSYYPIYLNLGQNNKKLRVLEVGCGYGYLTYSLHKMGHDVFGIDIAKNAIEFARQNFGDYFSISSIKEISNEKFDVIIATELIEHLQDPADFIFACTSLLVENGKIIITTPNKDFFPKKAIWATDLPPVHCFWLSKKSFIEFSLQNNFKCDFVNFSKYLSIRENGIILFFNSILSKIILPMPILNKDGTIYHKHVVISKVIKIAEKIFFLKLLNYIFNIVTKLFNPESKTLGVVFTKNASTQVDKEI